MNAAEKNDFICPACGAEVPARRRLVRSAARMRKTGWSDNTIYDGTGIEDPEEFDYEDWKRRELGRRKPSVGWVWWLVGVALFISFVGVCF